MTEQQVSKERFEQLRSKVDWNVHEVEDIYTIIAFAEQQEQAREAAEYSADEHYRHMMMWQEEAQSEKARAESLELSLRTACAERDAAQAVVAQVREWRVGATGRNLLDIVDAAAPEESDPAKSQQWEKRTYTLSYRLDSALPNLPECEESKDGKHKFASRMRGRRLYKECGFCGAAEKPSQLGKTIGDAVRNAEAPEGEE